jgi:UDP-N-acetylmuramoyl-L-alanyl-D-glutamate--2,6-diaminopimelate ligase
MRIDQIIQNISLISPKFHDLEFREIQIDSRLVSKGDIFFALDKKGINFIDDAIRNGAILSIHPAKIEVLNSLSFPSLDIKKDLIFALKQKYASLPKNLFAVTGTKGKSSIANFFLQFMNLLGTRAASIGTLGIKSNISGIEKVTQPSPLTTPDIVSIYRNLNILKKNNIDHVIIEASSIGLDQGRLQGIKLQSGIFTNLSTDHLDYHGDIKNYLACKMKLFHENISSGKAIINADFIEFKEIFYEISQTTNQILSFGKNGKDLQIIEIKLQEQGHKVKFSLNKKTFESEINLLGEFQIYNILATLLLISQSYILPEEKIIKLIKNFKNLQAAQGRMQLIFSGDYKIYLDFAHNPESLEQSLLAVKNNSKRLLVLFGCGGDRDKSKRPKMGQIATKIADFSIITDDNPRTENPQLIRQEIIRGCAGSEFIEIADRKNAIIEVIKKLQKDDTLIIAGKGHEKYQIIDNKKFAFDEKELVMSVINQSKN